MILGDRQWDIPRLHELLEGILPRNSFFNDFEVTHEFQQIGGRTMLLNARMLQAEGKTKLILLGIQDVTEMLQFQAELRVSDCAPRRQLWPLEPILCIPLNSS